MQRIDRLTVPMLLATLVVAGCGASPAPDARAAMGRVRLASNQVTYRDLGEALLFAAADDTLELAPGLFRGALEVKGKHLRIVGDTSGHSEVLIVDQGVRVEAGGGLTLENLTLRADGPVRVEPALDVHDSDLVLCNVRAVDLPRPLVRFDAPGRVLRLAHSLVAGGRTTSIALVHGQAHALGCVFADNVGPVFSRGPEAGRAHAGHGTFLGNQRLIDDGDDTANPVSLKACVIEAPRFPVDATANLVLAEGEAAGLFANRATGDYRPRHMERQDADGIDYGAVSSEDGGERLAKSIPRWLELYNDYAAIRASGFVSDGGDGRALQEAIRDTFYRRVAAFLTGGRRGLLVRDVLLALPFAPPEWHLRDRLDSGLRALATGLPGRVLVAGDSRAVPGLAERLEEFFARAYPVRDPNEERRFVIEVTQPLQTATAKEALAQEHQFANPEHAKISRSLSMADNRVAQLGRKATDLKGRLAGLAQVRAVSRLPEPTQEERRATEQLAQLQKELDEATTRQKELKKALEKLPPSVLCRFKGERRTTSESIALKINGELWFEPRRVHIEIDVAPEPACRFEGFRGHWSRPSEDSWLADELAAFLLARTWVAPRLEALQVGLLKPGLAHTESNDADAFFTLLFQDLRLLRGQAREVRAPAPAANPEWLSIAAGADGYPIVQVPYAPADPVADQEAWRLLGLAGRSAATYVEENYGEPLFLFGDAVR